MKLCHTVLIAGLFITRLHALDALQVAAVAKQFDNPSGDEQYKARAELNRLVHEASVPGEGDAAAVSKTLIQVLESANTSNEARKYILRALARLGSPDSAAPLAKWLADKNPMLSEEARQALSWIRSPAAVASLENALRKSTDKAAKLGLMDALALQQSASSVAVLAPFMVDPDVEIARAALATAARIGGADAVTTLTKANSSDKLAPAVKQDAEMALLIASSGDPIVATQLYQSSASPVVKLAAFNAAMQSAAPADKSRLIELGLKMEDPGLRQAALARGLETGLPSLLTSLAQAMDQAPKEDRMVVLANLHLLKDTDAAGKLAIGRVGSPDEDERISAIAALGRIGTQATFSAIIDALGAREPRVNQAAASALAGTRFPAAESTLTAMLKGDNSAAKVLAVKALAFRQLPDGNAILLEIVKGSDLAAFKEALRVLYATASIDDLRALCTQAAATENAELRRSIVSICSRIATRLNTDEARELVKTLVP